MWALSLGGGGGGGGGGGENNGSGRGPVSLVRPSRVRKKIAQ